MFFCFQLASVENEAAMLEQMVREQEEELAKTREENELEKVKIMFLSYFISNAPLIINNCKWMLESECDIQFVVFPSFRIR